MALREVTDVTSTHRIVLGLGSNLGDRVEALRRAVVALRAFIAIDRVSSVWDTLPQLVVDQPRFLNAALAGDTTLDPFAALRAVKALETSLGRLPSKRYGPRAIDVDLLLYGAWVVDSKELVIPHAGLAGRVFALAPLAEIAPETRPPNSHLTIAEMLARLPADGVRRLDVALT